MLNLISERLRTTSVKPSQRRPLFAYTWRDLGESSRLHCGALRKLSVAARTIQRASGTLRRGRRCCDRTIAEIAARAGVCRTLVQSAIREAARQGLITVEERRREGQKNLPNVVRVVSREWLTWLKRSGSLREPIGFRKIDPTDKKIDSPRGKRHAHRKKLFDKRLRQSCG